MLCTIMIIQQNLTLCDFDRFQISKISNNLSFSLESSSFIQSSSRPVSETITLPVAAQTALERVHNVKSASSYYSGLNWFNASAAVSCSAAV